MKCLCSSFKFGMNVQLEQEMGDANIIVVKTAREAEGAYSELLQSLQGNRQVVAVDCEGITNPNNPNNPNPNRMLCKVDRCPGRFVECGPGVST